jgi:inosine/xanthosine triphosphatase
VRVKVGVATLNPLKISAVKAAFGSFFGEVDVYSFKPRSTLPKQPLDEQIPSGAIARAREAIELGYNYGVGIEGGLVHIGGGAYLTGFSAAISSNGEMHGAWGLAWECPPGIRERVERGEELGTIMDELLGRTGVKEQEGAIGVLSKNKIDRLRVTTDSVIAALVPFVNQEFY